ncbi:MAG: S26 family signal peptidase [Promethearchaeota archaeon]
MKKSDYILIVSIFMVVTFVIVPIIIFNNSLYIIKGGSMEPNLYHGDLVIVIDKEPADIQAGSQDGDIVVIKGPEYYTDQGAEPDFWSTPNNTKIIHRVIDKKLINGTWHFLTKGDNNVMVDGSIRTIIKSEDYSIFEYNESNGVYITEDAIMGVIVFKIPFIGYLQEYGLLISIILIILILIYQLFSKKWHFQLFRSKRDGQKKLIKSKSYLILSGICLIILFLQIILMMNPFFFNVPNNSMNPILNQNDLAISTTKDPSEILIGDVVIIKSPQYFYDRGFPSILWSYFPNSSYIIHRVVDKMNINGSWHFKTKGDNSGYDFDGMYRTLSSSPGYLLFEYNKTNIIYIPQDAIIGVVEFKVPFIGFWKDNFLISLSIILILQILIMIIKKTEMRIKVSKRNQ